MALAYKFYPPIASLLVLKVCSDFGAVDTGYPRQLLSQGHLFLNGMLIVRGWRRFSFPLYACWLGDHVSDGRWIPEV